MACHLPPSIIARRGTFPKYACSEARIEGARSGDARSWCRCWVRSYADDEGAGEEGKLVELHGGG